MNCEENKDICGKMGVRGYPTIIFFINGTALKYEGQRETQAMASWIRAMFKPLLEYKTAEQIVEIAKSHEKSTYFLIRSLNLDKYEDMLSSFKGVIDIVAE